MNRPLLFLFAIALVSIVSGRARAATTVGSCMGASPYTTIQDAVNAASSGSTVMICPDTYAEQVVINKNLTIHGIASGSADAAIIVSPTLPWQTTPSLSSGFPIAAQVLVQGTTKVNLSNITVDGSNNLPENSCAGPNLVGIYYQNASGSVTDTAVVNQTMYPTNGCQEGLAILVQSGNGGTSNVTIANNHVQNYQKNGITGDGAGTTVTIRNNTVVGQGSTQGAAENSIQIGFGATGSITGNIAMDDIWEPDTSADSGDAASGILVYASSGVKVENNVVGNTQFGIAFDSDPSSGSADGGVITSNKIAATHIFDGIDLCNNSNTVQNNTVNGSDEAAIHIDSSCTNFGGGNTGSGNMISGNVINQACAGILRGTRAGNNTIGTNTFYDVRNTTLTADQCPAAAASVVPMAALGAARTVDGRHRAHPARP